MTGKRYDSFNLAPNSRVPEFFSTVCILSGTELISLTWQTQR
jgi:hypothetical protein